MSPHTIAVDLFALLLVLAGFHMVFRQHALRRWWRLLNGRAPSAKPRALGEDEDPAHYALIISGMMIMAFGLIIAAFTTAFDLMAP